MDNNKSFTACNIKLDKDTYIKDRFIFKNCYNEKKSKYNKISEN